MKTDRQLLLEIAHLCRRYAHWGVNQETHRLASKIATAIEKHDGECEMGSDEKLSEKAHG
jgi:hypothetical protein